MRRRIEIRKILLTVIACGFLFATEALALTETKMTVTYTTERTGEECIAKGGTPTGGSEGNIKCSFSKKQTVATETSYKYDLTKSECETQGGIFVNYSDDETVVCQFVEENIVVDDGGSGSSYVSQYNTGDWSRPAHPGREPAGVGSVDPGSSEVSNSESIEAVPGDGYSRPGGVQHEDQPQTSILNCTDSGNGEGIFCILNNALVVLTTGVGIAATVGIVMSGIQYATARDSVEQMTKARRRIINIIIGLVIYAVAWGFLNWLIPGGLF